MAKRNYMKMSALLSQKLCRLDDVRRERRIEEKSVTWRALANLMPGQSASAPRMIGHWTGSAKEAQNLIWKNKIIIKEYKMKLIIKDNAGHGITILLSI